MNIIPRISVYIVGKVFGTRYWLASQTRKHPSFAKIVRKIAFDEDDMIVLPKNSTAKRRTVEVGIDIDNAGDRNVMPSEIVKNVLRKSDKIFIMNFCLCRRSNKCQEYPISKGCIFVGRGTQSIPPEYGHFASSEEACNYIDECSELGLVHIIGRNKLDSIWLNTHNKRDLMTICNCCPCCCLWNMARDIDPLISATFRRVEGASVELDTSKCIGCGICYEQCFVRAISLANGKCSIDQGSCRACGRCTEACPADAITIGFDPGVVESETGRILSLVNQ